MPDDTVLTHLIVTYITAVNQLERKCAEFEKTRDSLRKSKLERAEAALAALDINEDIARMQASLNELKVRFEPGLSSPTQEVVDKAASLATEVGQVLATEKVTQILLARVTDFVNNFTAVVTGIAPAAAQAPGSTPKVTHSQWFAEHNNQT
ncbi:hypothetical protein [Caballeronia novacaledonica]|uniref:Uncharacterized protein n=1 Tax=Caballeronia novacaledonica TaxID=1544861 RepID=A0AA37IGM0_9BURK|nr:hypothetical protein [Caballeronia novacaledonica]GJH29312.1 hypothetical protein CBA19CS42_32370 [Caballeronia novacaledonica]